MNQKSVLFSILALTLVFPLPMQGSEGDVATCTDAVGNPLATNESLTGQGWAMCSVVTSIGRAGVVIDYGPTTVMGNFTLEGQPAFVIIEYGPMTICTLGDILDDFVVQFEVVTSAYGTIGQ